MLYKGKYWYGFARTVEIGISSVGSGSTTEVPIFVAPFRCKVRECLIVPKSKIVGADTNYMTLAFVNKGGDGSGNATISSLACTASIGTISAFDAKSFGAVSNNNLNEGDVISFKKAEAGNGANMPDLIAVLKITRR